MNKKTPKKSVSFFVTLYPHFGNCSIYTMEVNVTKNDTLKIWVINVFYNWNNFYKILINLGSPPGVDFGPIRVYFFAWGC